MTRTVAEKALQLLTRSVSDVVGADTRIADALVRALHSGEAGDIVVARMGFESLDAQTRWRVHGHAVALAQNLTVH